MCTRLKYRTALFLVLLFSVLTMSALLAQWCPGTLPPPRWVWSPVEIVDFTSMPAQASATAAGGWNGIQSNITLTFIGPFQDIVMIDDNSLPSGTTARTDLFDQSYSTCFLFLDTCGTCMNTNVMYVSSIRINANVLREVATQYGYSLATVATTVMSHELGHALSGLFDVTAITGKCAEVQSIMYGSTLARLSCGVTTAQIPCDQNILGAYPIPVPAWCPCSGFPC